MKLYDTIKSNKHNIWLNSTKKQIPAKGIRMEKTIEFLKFKTIMFKLGYNSFE